MNKPESRIAALVQNRHPQFRMAITRGHAPMRLNLQIRQVLLEWLEAAA